MKKANRSIFQKLCLISAVSSALLLTGCMGGSSDSNSYSHQDNTDSNNNLNYYESSQSSVGNLTSTGNRYSAYNGAISVDVNNIPVDVGKDVLYACIVTNPNNYTPITNLTIAPPLLHDVRASVAAEEDNASSAINVNIPGFVADFRENPLVKLQLKQELMQVYKAQEASNARCSVRAASHADEIEGQKGIEINVLNQKRKCTLAKVAKHAKIFIDEDGDGAVPAGNISEARLNEFATEFDNYIYPVMKENFGDDAGSDIFWNDVDGDGRLSIVFSPVVNNYSKGVTGIFDSVSINSQNPRDMISLSVFNDIPSEFDKWFMDARETIAHEMQHIINFCAKSNRSGSEELWIDEGLSVCAEILYRKRRSEAHLSTYSLYYKSMCEDFPGNDARLYCYAYIMPEIAVKEFLSVSNTHAYSKDSTTETLAHYGQKGLFFYYLYEQPYGKDVIRKLCRGESGSRKFSYLIPDCSLEQLIIDFNFAVLYEKLRNINLSSFPQNPINFAKSNHRFKTNMDLKFTSLDGQNYIEISEKNISILNLGTISKTTKIIDESSNCPVCPKGGTVRFLMRQPAEMRSALSGGTTYSFTLSTTSGVPFVVNMIRMTE